MWTGPHGRDLTSLSFQHKSPDEGNNTMGIKIAHHIMRNSHGHTEIRISLYVFLSQFFKKS